MRELSANSPEGWTDSRTERVGALADRQYGVVHKRQLVDLGVSRTTISRWAADGRIRRLYPSVFAVGHRVLRDEGRLTAALLHAGSGSALADETASWWHGLLAREPRQVHIVAPGDVQSCSGVVVRHPRELDVTYVRGLPVTTVARTLLDLAAKVPFRVLRRALAEADYQRSVTMDELVGVLGRGRAGSAALRRAIEQHWPGLALTRSELEERFLELCADHGIPRPEVNATVCGLMVDCLWPAERVIVELDGVAAHATPRAMERDRRRELTLRSAGHRVLRYTWSQVTAQPNAVAHDLLSELSANRPGRRD
jgi:predicted transcriptional regulator of viral defense system